MSRALRSLLFIPGDSDKKLAKVADCGADAVILDLEDAVAPANKLAAREKVADFLREFDRTAEGAPELWVRINPLDSGLAESDPSAFTHALLDRLIDNRITGPADSVRKGKIHARLYRCISLAALSRDRLHRDPRGDDADSDQDNGQHHGYLLSPEYE